MTRRSRRVAAAAAIAFALTVTYPGHAQQGVLDAATDGHVSPEVHPLEPVPELLIEPPPLSETLRLVEEASRTVSFCRALDMQDELAEPAPDDYGELTEFASRFHAITRLVDRKSRVADPLAAGKTFIDVPEDVLAAVEVQRRATFAFSARLQWAKAGFDAQRYGEREFRRRLLHAIAKLATSEFDQATLQLSSTRPQYCGT